MQNFTLDSMRTVLGTVLLACVLAVPCAQPAAAADARHAAFLKAARAFVVDHKFPDGEAIDKDTIDDDFARPPGVTTARLAIDKDTIDDDFAKNKLAIADVNGAGKPELLVRFESGTTASLLEYVCGFDEASGKVTVEFAGTPGLEYYDNGCLKEMVSHNQGLAGEFWPYSFAKYDPKKGKYEMKGSVDAWSSKEYPTNPFDNNKPFPKAVDAAGDGFVFFISDESFKGAKGPDTPVDTPVYEAWVKGYIGGAEPVKMDWVPATADGIKALETK